AALKHQPSCAIDVDRRGAGGGADAADGLAEVQHVRGAGDIDEDIGRGIGDLGLAADGVGGCAGPLKGATVVDGDRRGEGKQREIRGGQLQRATVVDSDSSGAKGAVRAGDANGSTVDVPVANIVVRIR